MARKGSRDLMYAAPRFSFTATADPPGTENDVTITTPCQPDTYSVPRTYPGYGYTIQNPNRLYPTIGAVPCVNGTQTWPRIVLGGMVRSNSAPRDTSVDGKFKVGGGPRAALGGPLSVSGGAQVMVCRRRATRVL